MLVKTGNTSNTIMWNAYDTTNYMRERIAEKSGIIETGLICMLNATGTE